MQASFTALATDFAVPKGGTGIAGPPGEANPGPVWYAAIANAPATDAAPAASPCTFAAPRVLSPGCSTQCTAAVAAPLSGSDIALPQACWKHKQPHHTASRGGNAWARKSIPAMYCLLAIKASMNGAGPIPSRKSARASLLARKRAQISAAVAASILTSGALLNARFPQQN